MMNRDWRLKLKGCYFLTQLKSKSSWLVVHDVVYDDGFLWVMGMIRLESAGLKQKVHTPAHDHHVYPS